MPAAQTSLCLVELSITTETSLSQLMLEVCMHNVCAIVCAEDRVVHTQYMLYVDILDMTRVLYLMVKFVGLRSMFAYCIEAVPLLLWQRTSVMV